MQGRARLVAAATARGTDVVEAYAEPPFSFRPTARGVVHMVAAAAGPVGGDELLLEVVVEAGAHLAVRSTGASLVMPGRGDRPSTYEIRIVVEDGGVLDWQPLPTILVDGCHHLARTTVELAAGAVLRWREDLVVGRTDDEAPRRARSALRACREGEVVLHHELDVGREVPGWDSSFALAGRRVVSTELAVGELGGEGGLVHRSAVADDAVVAELAPDVWWGLALRGREEASTRPGHIRCII